MDNADQWRSMWEKEQTHNEELATRNRELEAENRALQEALVPFAKIAGESAVERARKAGKGCVHTVLSIKDLDRAIGKKQVKS